MAQARRVTRNLAALILASVLSKGTLFVWQIALGRWLGLDDYGIYNTVLSVLAVTTPLASLGMGLIVIREVARQPDQLGVYWAAALGWQTLFGGLAYVLALLGGLLAGYSPIILAYTALGGLSLLIDLFGNTANDLLLAQERMVVTSVVEVSHTFLRVALALAAMLAGWELLGLYSVTLLSSIGRSSLLIGLNLRAGWRPRFPVSPELRRRLLFSSAPLALAAILSLAYQHADKLLTTAILGERSTGFLGPAFLVSFGVVELLNTTVLVATYPLMSRSYAAPQTRASFGHLVEILGRFMAVIGAPIALVFFVYGPALVGLIYPSEFAPAGQVLRLLILYTWVTMIVNVLAQGLLVQDQQAYTLRARARSLALNIVVSVGLLLTTGDVRGAVLATLAAELLLGTQLLARFRSEGFELERFLKRAGRLLLAVLVGGALMLALEGSSLLGVSLGLLAYGLAALALRAIDPGDWDFLEGLAAHLPLSGLWAAVLRRLRPA
ncbi:MAG: oligosaccharide flippase family protein [Anaerolineae bacterium]|nr:oligosaccharide flippase family protein [Anaerolineae bacterium]MDW8171210.1 oligosaccharide flippase family protein [Anaerolineae bacterium]